MHVMMGSFINPIMLSSLTNKWHSRNESKKKKFKRKKNGMKNKKALRRKDGYTSEMIITFGYRFLLCVNCVNVQGLFPFFFSFFTFDLLFGCGKQWLISR